MAESLLKRSNAKSILNRSNVKHEDYLRLKESQEEEKIERKAKKEGLLSRAEHGLVHWVTEKPEEHKYLHGLAEGLRHQIHIEGATPEERMKSIGVGVEHGVGKVGGGLLGFVKSERERMAQQYSQPSAMPASVVRGTQAMMPSSMVEGTEVEMPSAVIERGEPARTEIPSGDEILVCKRVKLRDVM
jgi:hypothetical protein